MRLNQVNFEGVTPVNGYGPGFFRIGDTVFEGACLLDGSGPRSWGGFDDVVSLEAMAGSVDVIFLGTGAEIAPAPQEVRTRLEALGIGLEVMSSPTACRTYNVLLSEGRRIAAALLPV